MVGFKSFFTAKNVAYLAVLLALVVVLQIWASSIPVGQNGAMLNFSLIPIVLGAILLGPIGGVFLGFACGVVVLIQVIVMTGSPFYVAIWANSPVVTTFTCILKTTAAGLVAGFCYRLISEKNKLVAVFAASAVVPVINTGLFILGCLCMSDTIADFGGELGNAGDIFVFILVFLVSFNFFIELGINLVLSPAIHRVVLIAEKRLSVKKNVKAEPEDGDAQTETISPQTEKLT